MATLQEQARALGDPTRHAIFRSVADARQPVDVAELTERFGLNHNAIRQHLAKLVEAELVVEAKAPAVGRGRPRLVYSLDPRADSKWGVTGPYERLSLWLAEMVRTGATPVEVGRGVGRNRRLRSTGTGRGTGSGTAKAKGRATADGADAVAVLVDEMARHGFDPTVRRRGDDVEVTLRTCPFATTALSDPDTVCELHLGIALGMAENLEGLEIDELIRKDPRRAHCRLRGHLVSPA